MIKFLLAQSMTYAGRAEEAISLFKKSMRLEPRCPVAYLMILNTAYRLERRFEEAIAVLKQVLDRSLKGEFNPTYPHIGLAGVYTELGREEEGRAHVTEVLKLNPNYSLENWKKIIFFKNIVDENRYIDALRKAGLPD